MNRLWIAAGLAVILVVILVLGIGCVNSYAASTGKRIEKIERLAQQGSTQQCIEACGELEQHWIVAEKALNVYLNHSELCEIGLNVAQLKPLFENGEDAAFFAALSCVRVQLTHMANAETVGF